MISEDEKYERSLKNFVLNLLAWGIGLGMFGTCVEEDIQREVGKLEEKLKPKIILKNTLGGKAHERFYEIKGKRVYLEIDGKPIEQYFSERTKIE